MKELLLDTQAFLLLRSGSEKIPKRVISAVKDTHNNLYVSLVSVWEIAIKLSINKLSLSIGLDELIQSGIKMGIQLLTIKLEHLYKLTTLPYHHKDPFDRLLITQAITEDLTIISNDHYFSKYEVKVLW